VLESVSQSVCSNAYCSAGVLLYVLVLGVGLGDANLGILKFSLLMCYKHGRHVCSEVLSARLLCVVPTMVRLCQAPGGGHVGFPVTICIEFVPLPTSLCSLATFAPGAGSYIRHNPTVAGS